MLDILLVDDEPDFRALVGDALRDAGHRLTLAANGAEGLSLISANVLEKGAIWRPSGDCPTAATDTMPSDAAGSSTPISIFAARRSRSSSAG